MGHRIPLKPNTLLYLCNKKGEVFHCMIEKELGRGGSCIVYEVSRETETGDKTYYRLKEFYPYKLKIDRDENNYLIPEKSDIEQFIRRQEKLQEDFSYMNKLYYSSTNYSMMTNQLDIFKQNGTFYILSTYSSDKTLANYKPSSLKECITLVKQVAYVIDNLHKQGYLYLDIKPENVLVVDNFQKQIQLFDFDSFLSIQDLNHWNRQDGVDIKLSYSKGFAAIELQTSKIKRLGFHTDVFGVGALLFYLLFGNTPNALDCEVDAEYNFQNIQYDDQKCDDRLFTSLTDLFHKTIAVYYADRYQSMQEVLEQLETIEKYADHIVPRIYSTKIVKPKVVFGREDEFKELDRLLESDEYNCIFITGMGGIGKSTFIREYLSNRRQNYDTILYVPYQESVENTISNDKYIEINTLKQEEEGKSNTRYFDKKIQKIREIVRENKTILVIDNFFGKVDDDLREVLGTNLKVILLSRQSPSYQSSQELKLCAISNPTALRQIFEINLGRNIDTDEVSDYENILQYIDRHTLVLELIAKQIANSHITISSAMSLVKEYGFSFIASEKISYERDNEYFNDTIGNIISALFVSNDLSREKKILLKIASLFGDSGIDIKQFHQIMKISSMDNANELIKDGWLMLDGSILSMHRVIQETVRHWEWNPDFMEAVEQLLTYFYIEIRLESTKNNFPRKLRERMSIFELASLNKVSKSSIYKKMLDWCGYMLEQQFQKQGIIGMVTRERYARIHDETPADMEKLSSLLVQAENILNQCKRETMIQKNDIYINLLSITILNMPQYREEYILTETRDILAKIDQDFTTKNKLELFDEVESNNPVVMMKFYDIVITIYAENGRISEAENMLKKAKWLADKVRHHKVYALYYNLDSNYCDILLNGAYCTEENDEEVLLNRMLNSIEKTLKYSKKGFAYDGDHLYVKHILAKATILMRSGKGSDGEIDKLMENAKKIIYENTSQYADVRIQYYLVCGWYFALVNENEDRMEFFIQNVRELSEKIIAIDFRMIEDVLMPCANMYFQLKCYEKSIHLLDEGIKLCAKHANTDAYARMKKALCEHIWEVAMEAKEFELCQKILYRVECENDEIIDPSNKVVVAKEIRDLIVMQ